MINSTLSEIADKVLAKYRYNQPYDCNTDLYLILLKYADTSCYNKKELSKYNQIVSELTFDCTVKKPDLYINKDGRTEWVKDNPNCSSYKDWEIIAYNVCKQYKLDINLERFVSDCKLNVTTELVTKTCDVTLDIVKNTISCNVLTAISIQNLMCDLNIKVEKSKEDCKIDLKLLYEKVPSCDLDLTNYFALINNNFSFELISLIYKEGLSLEVIDNRIYLVTPTNKYEINKDLKFNYLVTSAQDPYLLVAYEILSDYKLSKDQKEKIINGKYIV